MIEVFKRSPTWLERWALGASACAVLVAFALVWVPEIRLYWPGFSSIEGSQITAARTDPPDAVIKEIGTQYLGLPAIERFEGENATKRLAAAANDVLKGRRALGGYMAEPLPFPFRASNLEIGLPGQQLLVGSMVTTHLLLQAYHATSDRRYLKGALQEAVAFAAVDEKSLVPKGFLWNDHAIAARVSVLADLWSVIRTDPELIEDDAKALLALADRSAARLAKPALYTFRTNHGVMQSLALVQFAVAFPTLHRAGEFKDVGCSRLVEQFNYYMDQDGITLEHSAGYHELGRQLLTRAVRLFELSGCTIPGDWRSKLAGAVEFSHLLTRPDLTLPVIGNTDHGAMPADEAVDPRSRPRKDHALEATAGFAVWWNGLDAWPDPGSLSQTAVTWSKFPSRAHKLDDDMSLVIWAAGRPWITNTGYWPYGIEGFDDANGWRGSNAPHLVGEARRGDTVTVLRRHGFTPQIQFLELHRTTGGVTLRREIVSVIGGIWIVIDSAEGKPGPLVNRLWTTMPATVVEKVEDSAYLLRGKDAQQQARVTFLGDMARPPSMREGDLQPFAGWTVRSARPTPSPAFEVRMPVPGTSATVLSVGSSSALAPTLGPVTPDGWHLNLEQAGSDVAIERRGNQLTVSRSGGITVETLALMELDNSQLASRDAIVSAYEAAAAKYPRKKELTYYRYRLSVMMLGLLALQELALFAVRRWNRSVALSLRILGTPAWLTVGLWADLVYLQ